MKTVKVYREENPSNPRKEFDNFGVIVTWGNKYVWCDNMYKLGDEQPKEEPEEFLKTLPPKTVRLPLYLYDHSGITISTKQFNCKWDSGQIGWIYATPEMIRKEYSTKRITKKLIEKVKKLLEAEVKIYDQYLTGMVWGYVIEETEQCTTCKAESSEQIDSCCGFYGETLEETGMKDSVDESLHAALEEAFDNPIY